MASIKQKRVDAQLRLKLERKIGKQHPYWTMGQVWAQVDVEVAKIKARKSLHDQGMDALTIARIEYIGAIRGETATEVIARAIDAQVGEYPDLCRTGDEYQARSGEAEQRDHAEVTGSPEGAI